VKSTGLRCYGMTAMDAYEAAFIDDETGDPSLVVFDRLGDNGIDGEHFAGSATEQERERRTA
jgi:hypothetical protein